MVALNTWLFAPEGETPTLAPISGESLFAARGRTAAAQARVRWFISHHYSDPASRDALLAMLPGWIEPVVFPPITVPPEQFVSDELLAAIASCDGLVYVGREPGLPRGWVNFERRFALRTGKRVAGFSAKDRAFQLDTSKPENLIVPCWNSSLGFDDALARRALTWLQANRSVNRLGTGGRDDGLATALARGATVVVFLSNAGAVGPWPDEHRIRFEAIDSEFQRAIERCLFVWLEAPDRAMLERALGQGPRDPFAFHRVLLHGLGRADVQIAVNGEIDNRRLDDVLVRLEDLAARHRASAAGGKAGSFEEQYARQKEVERKLGLKPWEGAQLA